MCYRHTICEHYKHCDGNELPEACLNCAYAQQVKRTSRFCQIGLLLAMLAFIVTTYIVY